MREDLETLDDTPGREADPWQNIMEACQDHMRALIDLHEAARSDMKLRMETERGIQRLAEGLPSGKREFFLSLFEPSSARLKRIFRLLRFQASAPLRGINTVEAAEMVYRAVENIFLRRS